MRERGGATDTCRSSRWWPNEVRGTRWTRIWPDSIIYSHALSSELFKAWKGFCLTCTSGQQVDLSLRVFNRQTGPSPFFTSSILMSKPKAKSNQTHTETPANTYCTMYSVEAQSEEAEGLPHALFSGLIYPREYTHYSKYSKYSWMEWPLMLNLHDSRAESWFKSRVWLHMTCVTLASGAAESSYRS